jgi:hypothetical protein
MCRLRWLILLSSLVVVSSVASAQDVTLVANESVNIPRISSANVRAIFLGAKTRFSDGSHAVPVTLKGGAVHEVFLRNLVGESAGEFRAQWRRAVFTGQGAMPRAFDSESALLDYVTATPGALGYVSHVPPGCHVKSIPIDK